MLHSAFDKKFLFGTTVMAGFAALTVMSGPAWAQASPASAAQTSPANQMTPGTANDPAVVSPDSDDENQVDAPQEEAREDDPSEVEAVIVTGSRIRRDPTNAPTPLIQLNREEILQSGQTNLVDFLADVPALQSSITPTDQTSGGLGLGGLSALNLRNLGTARTLVLVDGRRHVGATRGTLVVDIDTIPSLLIENTEIVTGGQSALYGTDAVAGVVNFVLRRNFEGVEIDGSLAQINQDGQLSGKIGGLVGKNLLNDRLNVYGFAEYQRDETVLDLDIDHLQDANILIGVDSDPSAGEPDGDPDVIAISNARDAFFARGGVVILSNQVRPSTGFIPGTNRIADPDFTPANCGAVPTLAQRRTQLIGANCMNVVPDQPGKVFTFNADGTARPFNFGTFIDPNGNSRRINVGGDGLNPNAEFGQSARFPEQENQRYQAGFNFDLTEGLQLFGEAKYAKDETSLNASQPTFFQATLQEIPANTVGAINGNSGNVNIYGLDNAFLPANLRQAILANTRPIYDLALGTAAAPNPNFGNQIGTVADPRAFLGVFGPSRPQTNTREVERYVLGLRGDRDQLGFISNFSYEASYTYGQTNFINVEEAVDSERFFFATDAVRNASGQIVCRVQDLAARGITIPDQLGPSGYAIPGRTDVLSPTSPVVTQCTPVNIFGSDFRTDADHPNATGGGGRPNLTPEQRAYVTAQVSTNDTNTQNDFLAFASGEVLESVLPAGPIGIAVGYEYRKEEFQGFGREQGRGSRLLLLNNSFNNPGGQYDTSEFFTEVRLPLLRDLPFAEALEVSGAYRTSENSVESIGKLQTFSLLGSYRPTRDVLFRFTYGESTRIPTLTDLFDTGSQTFANLTDPCDATVLRNLADPVIRANRRTNCVALLGAGYDPDTTQLIYPASTNGAGFAGNPLLEAEDGRSYTASIVFTPRFAPRLSLVLDYYDIKLTNAIQTPAAQTNLNNCFSGTVVNEAACSLFDRNGPNPSGSGQNAIPFGLTFFRQGAQNFAATLAKGIDFNARYSLDTADFLSRDLGRIDYSLRGTYTIRQENFLNQNDPSDATENDGNVGNPRVRFRSNVTLSPTDRFSATWVWDYQTSQELLDSDFFLQDPDNRSPEFAETGSFSAHDFSARYEVRDGITVRAGVINAFDAEPPLTVAPPGQLGDIFDLFGRRFFIGANIKLGAARN